VASKARFSVANTRIPAPNPVFVSSDGPSAFASAGREYWEEMERERAWTREMVLAERKRQGEGGYVEEFSLLMSMEECATVEGRRGIWGARRVGTKTLEIICGCNLPLALSFILDSEGRHLLSRCGSRETAQILIDRLDLDKDEFLSAAEGRGESVKRRTEEVKRENGGGILFEIDRAGREKSGESEVEVFRAMLDACSGGDWGDLGVNRYQAGLEWSAECDLPWALRFFLSMRYDPCGSLSRPMFDWLSAWDGFQGERYMPLYQAIVFFEYDRALSLLQGGVDVNSGSLMDGETPLMRAVAPQRFILHAVWRLSRSSWRAALTSTLLTTTATRR
jgi:hypothetical protein